jgi:hypothetical protein
MCILNVYMHLGLDIVLNKLEDIYFLKTSLEEIYVINELGGLIGLAIKHALEPSSF